MTITAIAKGLNVSPMTIYRRLKKAGISLDGLRDANGEITAAGASVIASLFDAPQDATEGRSGDATECNTVASQAAQHDGSGDSAGQMAASAQVEVLTAKLEAAVEKISMLEAERDRLVDQLAAVTAALEREQADRQSERLLLTGGQDENSQKRGFLAWFFRKR